MLARTLGSLAGLKLDQYVVVLDRCSDRSEMLVKKFLAPLKLVKVERESGWRIHLNYLYKLGIEEADGDVVFLTQADIAVDSRIRSYLSLAEDRVVSFRNLPYLGWTTGVVLALTSLPFARRFSGLLAFPRDWFFKYHLFRDTDILFDTQIYSTVKKLRLPYMYVKTNSWNLRPYTPRAKLYELGAARRKLGRGFLPTLLRAYVYLQPEVAVGWMWEAGS